MVRCGWMSCACASRHAVEAPNHQLMKYLDFMPHTSLYCISEAKVPSNYPCWLFLLGSVLGPIETLDIGSGMVKTMVKWFNINPYHRSLNLEDISPVYLVLNDHPAKVEMSCCPNSTCFNLCRFMPKLIRRPKAALASWSPIAEPEPPKIIVFQLLEDTSGDDTFCGSTRSSIAFAFTFLQCGVASLYQILPVVVSPFPTCPIYGYCIKSSAKKGRRVVCGWPLVSSIRTPTKGIGLLRFSASCTISKSQLGLAEAAVTASTAGEFVHCR